MLFEQLLNWNVTFSCWAISFFDFWIIHNTLHYITYFIERIHGNDFIDIYSETRTVSNTRQRRKSIQAKCETRYCGKLIQGGIMTVVSRYLCGSWAFCSADCRQWKQHFGWREVYSITLSPTTRVRVKAKQHQ